jgi:hypothetical protein
VARLIMEGSKMIMDLYFVFITILED